MRPLESMGDDAAGWEERFMAAWDALLQMEHRAETAEAKVAELRGSMGRRRMGKTIAQRISAAAKPANLAGKPHAAA